MTLIIERFEDEWAIIEYGKITFQIPKALLDPLIHEGDVVEFMITKNESESLKRKKLIDDLSNRLFKK